MNKKELYPFALLNHLAKKIYAQEAKIDLILDYIIEKNNLPESMYDKIKETVIKSNIECLKDIDVIYDNIDDNNFNDNDFLK
ncbi:hypothetical protein ACFO3O_10950 [Dokdonia ponticola]|uniref:Uncharacterized protein n=1 Tax=Dokdonia ponticola TaxID=2041041 RepID=A0ABV9HW98_9FLAO